MKDDKYKPDVAKVLRTMDPVQVLERRRKGLAEFYGSEKEAEPTEARTSAPSPWAEGTAGEINKAALPSATMPTADVSPMTTPVGLKMARRTWPASWKLAGGLALTVAVTFVLAVGVLAGRAKEKAKVAATTSTAVAAVPSVEATQVAPTTPAPGASSVPIATATATASSVLRAPSKRTSGNADPHDGMGQPSPPVSAASPVPAAPTSAPSVPGPQPPPPAPATDTDPDPFMRKRPH